MLFRKIESYIWDYLKSDSNKVLMIDGARQIGKTYIIRKVGKDIFENFIEVNMIEDAARDKLFANVNSVEDFYFALSTIAGDKMQKKRKHPYFS